MQDTIGKIGSLIPENPLLALSAIVAVLVLGAVIWAVQTPVLRRAFVKFYYLARNTLSADLEWRDLAYWLIIGAFVALPIALSRGWGKGGDSTFHWQEFFIVIAIVALGNAARIVFSGLSESRRILRPVHGGFWRQNRKIATAAILKKVNTLVDNRPADETQVKKLITDLLEIIVLHVRDHRGNHKRVDVFANLLLIQGDDLVVVARDPTLHTNDYRREIPKWYKKAALVAGRAIESKTAVSVGDLTIEYPEAPKNKPYRSILAIPLMTSDNERPIGALSIDSTRPYFFESFTPGTVENDLENSLAPYLHTLILVLEVLLSRDPTMMLDALLRGGERSSVGEAGGLNGH